VSTDPDTGHKELIRHDSTPIARWGPNCDADLTGANNNGIPAGIIDASDFFFYQQAFADGRDIADLSSPTVPGAPDGIIDSTDFFYYMDQFELGAICAR